MAEVARLEGKQLGTLADKINTEHRACVAAVHSALAHAIEAGRLLTEAKESLPPDTTWEQWVEDNFEASARTERVYRRLYSEQETLKQSGSSAATLSIRQALKVIADAQRPPKPKPLWGPDPFANLPEGLEPDPAVLKGWEEDQEAIAAWKKQRGKELANVRAEERAKGMRSLLLGLDDLTRRYPTKEAGVALAEMVGEGRALEAVGECITWLEQVLEVAEREQGRMQNGA